MLDSLGEYKAIITKVGFGLDAAGVAVIAIGAIIATIFSLARIRRRTEHENFRDYRQSLGRAILLGLEFIVAGDIIRTVAVDPTYSSVGVLSIIILIRTFLSLNIQVETEGRFPWKRKT